MEHTSIEKAIDVLFHLHSEGAPRGVTAIGEALGMPKSSAHRLLTALGRRGLVEQDDRGRYLPGIALVGLGLGVLDREPVVAAARPVLEAEVERLGETLFVAGVRGGRIVVLDKVEGPGFLRAAPQVGAEVPIHATAVGKLHMAFEPDALAAAARPRERFTIHTPITDEALERAVARALERGWAANVEEWIRGLTVVAAPIRAGARMLGCVALAAPSAAIASDGVSALGEHLKEVGRTIARRLEATKS